VLSSFTIRFRNFIWFLIFTFTLYCMPHIEMLLPYEIHISFSEAEAAEVESSETQATETQAERDQEIAAEEASTGEASSSQESSAEASSAAASSEGGSSDLGFSSVSFKVDDFSGAAHLSYPIVVPPGRSGLAPQLSLSYTSSGGNGWLGVGWDIPIGYIQRRGPRKGVPKYDDTKDVYELNLGGASQELVSIGNDEYRLKIEGALLWIKYFSTGNYWEVKDKSGTKMTFGATVNLLYSRIGKVRDPETKNETFRWCLNRVEDTRSNYMELIYFRDQDANNTYQVYLQEINYNGQVSGSLPHNHRVIFNLESTDRPDPIFNYRGGFKTLTRKRLSSIEIKTNGTPVRKYQLEYMVSNTRSLLSQVILYGKDYQSNPNPIPLPPTVFTYQAIDMQNVDNRGFGVLNNWPNPSNWAEETGDPKNPYRYYGNYLRNNKVNSGIVADVIDIDGDGLVDRVTYDKTSPYNTWDVFTNNLEGFDTPSMGWSNPSGTDWGEANYIRKPDKGSKADVIDMDGDGLPDRVVYDRTKPYDTWRVYFNNGNGFNSGENWSNPSIWKSGIYWFGNVIRDIDTHGTSTDVIDMNGDGRPDRVVYDKDYNYDPQNPQPAYWKVYLNTGSGFDPNYISWLNPSPWSDINGNYIRNTNTLGYGTYTDVIDLNGDGLPDRVVYNKNCTSPYTNCPWTVYFNNGSGFDPGVDWPNPSAWDDKGGNYIRSNYVLIGDEIYNYGTTTDVIDVNGDGLPDRVVYDRWTSEHKTWKVYFNYGSGFGLGVDWPNPSAWDNIRGNLIQDIDLYGSGSITGVMDMDGDGLPDRLVYDRTSPYNTWSVYFNKGPISDFLSKVENGIGGTTEISYLSSTAYEDGSGNRVNHVPFVVQTVRSYTQNDGRGNSYLHKYFYSDAFYDSAEVEFRGFKYVTAYQMANPTEYESMTETEFLQDYYLKGRVLNQTLTSKEGHTRQVDNLWVVQDNGNGTRFPRLDQTTSTITDIGAGGPYTYSHSSTYTYDQYFNVAEEHKWHLEGSQWVEDIRTYFNYTNITDKHILSKPTEIRVTDGSGNIVSRKWMDYYSTNGNIYKEEVCKSNTPSTGCLNRNSAPPNDPNPVINYGYNTYGNLWIITDPRGCQTTINYDSTETHVYTTTNCLDHVTTTEYDPGTGNLTKLIPPHLQLTTYSIDYSYDEYGRKEFEIQPIPMGGWTFYEYSLGDPFNNNQYVKKTEHIVGGPSVLDHETYNYFDGMGRTYWVRSSGPESKWIYTETQFDNLGRVWRKYNPRFNTDSTPYPYTEFAYDGLSRVIETAIPDDDDPSGFTYISTTYQGLKKVVTNQRGYSTAYTYDVYQRMRKVEDPYSTFTEYDYDTLGNLTQVRAAKDASGNNLLGASITTTMTYDSLSKKRTMNDPDMGSWQYYYDKSGNLLLQIDAKNQAIAFDYDGLNRVTHKNYCITYTLNPPNPFTCTSIDHSIDFEYDTLSKGMLTSISDAQNGTYDQVLEYDLLQRVKGSQKAIGSNVKTFENTYDSAGRRISIKYPGNQIYNYRYDVAGNLLYLMDNATQNNVVAYSNFTALGQPRQANFSNSVITMYDYYLKTARLHTLLTQKSGNPAYQNLTYQYDPKGTIINLNDQKNGIIHTYGYDPLDRLDWAKGNNGSVYDHDYNYDRIGNIKFKTDVGTYNYNYSNRPHAVNSTSGAINIDLQYDANGNMTQRVQGGVTTTVVWNYDNKPATITQGSTSVSFIYDGNGQRVKKQSSVSGITFYYGELYEVRNGVEVLHLFAGNRRVASIRLTDGKNQFYHPNHLGSASFITDSNGDPKEQIEYHPFGTYRDVGSLTGTYDYDPNFPDVNYTFTDQEDDDELGFYNYGARLYDPVLGRFISPDRLVPDPGDPQALNRYTYCLNNPLIYTDPSGEFWWLVIVAFAFGALYGAGQADMNNQNVLLGALKGGLIAAVSAAVGYGITMYLFPAAAGAESFAALSPAMQKAAQAIGTFTGGAMQGGLDAAANGGNVWQAALYSGLTAVAMFVIIQGIIELNNWVTNNSLVKDQRTMYAQARTSMRDVNPITEEEVTPYVYGETSGVRPGASTAEELAQAREAIGHVYVNRMEAGMDAGMYRATPDPNNPVEIRQWNQCLTAVRNALRAAQDPTGGAVQMNMRAASIPNATTAPHVEWRLPVFRYYGQFQNTAPGAVPRGPMYIIIYR